MAKFQTGQTVCTRGIADRMANDDCFAAFVLLSLDRYTHCDWGEMSEDDKRMNDEAVETGEDRIFASYTRVCYPEDKIWIITEWDRSATTILFPSEY